MTDKAIVAELQRRKRVSKRWYDASERRVWRALRRKR